MSAYLGTLGRLVPIKCSAQPVARAERYSFDTTLEGRRKAQVIGETPREWAVDFKLGSAEQNAALFAFADGEWGIGPFMWESPEAQVTNLYTPAVASCDPVVMPSDATAAGPMPLGDGSYAGRSYMPSGQFMFFGAVGDVPVLPGVPVTGSAYVLGAGAAARVNFYGSDGLRIGEPITSTVTATAGSPVRSHVTAMPPANAVSALVSIENTTQAARPAITWTDRLLGYSNGNGCTKAVIDGLDRTPVLITKADYRATTSFTIREVG